MWNILGEYYGASSEKAHFCYSISCCHPNVLRQGLELLEHDMVFIILTDDNDLWTSLMQMSLSQLSITCGNH